MTVAPLARVRLNAVNLVDVFVAGGWRVAIVVDLSIGVRALASKSKIGDA